MARNENYGNELSKIILLTKTMENQSDSIYQHTDINGNHWEILLSQSTDGNETCFNATAIRNKTDSTQSLYFCKYHSNLEVRNE
ncbi:hypothetical protein [Fibrobacter sp. UWH1]|uniref:hypothetical protein n=1 Tax=Fibrobacter sp. UWH1 TaxID=1964354 RepID=UPI0020CCBD00|nr:hypothetical protein [Fibrobacter sp. UWH1]